MEKPKVWIMRRKTRKTRKTKRGLEPVYSYSVQWIDRITKKTRTKSCGNDRTYAEQQAGKLRQEIADGLFKSIKAISYDDFVREHLELMAGKRRAKTLVEIDLALRQFKAACDPLKLTDIDYTMLERFQGSRIADGVSPWTANKGLQILQGVLTHAVKRGYLKINPFAGNRRELFLKTPEITPETLTDDQFDELYDACQDDRWRAFCLLGCHAGLRSGEISWLEWSDIDFDQGVLWVRNKDDEHSTKSGKERMIPMSLKMIEVLSRMQVWRLKSKFVVTNSKGDQMLNNIGGCFGRIVTRAKLVGKDDKPLFSPHDLRRTFGTNLANRGKSPKVVMDLMGHADLTTTMKFYVDANVEEKKKAILEMTA